MKAAWNIQWVDRGREPTQPPNPDYPNGLDVDLSGGSPDTCLSFLDYPAPRIGIYLIECRRCGHTAAVTTAGRPDDPRSLKLACKLKV